jgi:PAS domain S-box-containing protein
MSPLKRFQLLRFLERFIFLFCIVWAAALVYWHERFALTQQELLTGIGILLLVILIHIYTQKKIDAWFLVTLSQSSYAQDDAFAALFERSPVAYFIIDAAGTIVETNPAAVKLLRAEVATISHTNFFDRIQRETTIDETVLRGKLRAGVTVTDLELPLQTMNEETIWVLFSAFAYRSASQRLIALVDITEQKQIDTAKSEFVALATHQLRTPIAAIRWNVELLQKSLTETVTTAQQNYLSKIERNVLRMIALINDFLSASKLEMGTYATTKETVVLSELFSSVADEFMDKITQKQIVLERQEIPASIAISTDPRLLHIIVSNLVSNAVKYLHAEGTINLSYEVQGSTVVIIVADNGIGIPEAELDKLFTKFYRASNAESHQTEGTGLGLYIVKQSVELLGGRISVVSKENEGARFLVSLPVS